MSWDSGYRWDVGSFLQSKINTEDMPRVMFTFSDHGGLDITFAEDDVSASFLEVLGPKLRDIMGQFVYLRADERLLTSIKMTVIQFLQNAISQGVLFRGPFAGKWEVRIPKSV